MFDSLMIAVERARIWTLRTAIGGITDDSAEV